jgi:hypothetical protein
MNLQIKIYFRWHIYTAAKHLTEQLCGLGYDAVLVVDVDANDDSLYIIYCAFCISQFPKNYIVYQTEVAGSKWFDEQYRKILAGASAVWDYSEENLKHYTYLGKAASIVTPGIALVEGKIKEERDIPLLFYGSLNERRRNLLTSVKRYGKIYMAHNLYGEEMYALLRRTKVVLNLHYYQHAPLEVFRINEALSYGCHVVSEPDAPAAGRYWHCTFFAGTIKDFETAIGKALAKPFNYDLTNLSNSEEIKAALEKVKLYPPR